MLTDLRAKNPELLGAIRSQGEVSADTEKGLSAFLDDFARSFA
jgi:hypothetical protein